MIRRTATYTALPHRIVSTILLIAAMAVLPYIFISSTASAQEKPVLLTAEADKTEITVGDPITYTVTAIYEKDWHVEFMPPGTNLGSFEIRDYEKEGPIKLDDGRSEEIYRYVIAVYEVGSFEIPAAQVSYWKREEEKDIVDAAAIKITVKSVRGEGGRDIQDIKEPLSVWPNFVRYVLIGAGIFAGLGLITFLLALLIKKIKASEAAAPEERALRIPANVAAMNSLDEIDRKDLPGKGEVKQFYIEISDVIRRYIERRFDIAAMERTTEEIVRDLRGAGVPGGVNAIESFLRDADMVKFAKYRPDRAACREDMARARRIIETTTEVAA